MNRRGFVGGVVAAGLGGNPPIRPDQAMQLQRTGAGSGPAPQSAFIVARRVVIIGTTGGLFVYSPTAGAGNLVASIAATAGTDQYGNAYQQGVAAYNTVPGRFSELSNGNLILSSNFGTTTINTPGNVTLGDSRSPGAAPTITATSPGTTLGGTVVSLVLQGKSNNSVTPAQAIIGLTANPTPTTSALLEVQGDAQFGDGMSIGQAAAVQGLNNGSTINTANITMQPVTALLSVTGLILQAGTFDGQFIVIPSDAGAGITMTFAAAATSNVKLGTGAVMQPGRANVFVWVASTSRWYLALTA